jgi:hypothetical protein
MPTTYYQTKIQPEPLYPDFVKLLTGIVASLPLEDGWTTTNDNYRNTATLRATTGPTAGLQIYIRHETKSLRAGQDTQIGPKGARYLHSYNTPAPSITLNARSTPKSIADSIARRLLPEARRLFAEECTVMDDWWTKQRQRDEAIQTIEEITGRKRSSHTEYSIYLYRGKVDVVSADSIRVELDGLDINTAVQLLAQYAPA